MSTTSNRAAPTLLRLALPPVAAALALAWLGWADAEQPWALALLGLLGGIGYAVAIRYLPVLLYWVVPALIPLPVILPLLPYEAVLVLLALPLLAHTAVSLAHRAPRLDAIEWRYALFLLLLLPGALNVQSWWRYFGQLKMFALGWIAFELTRIATRRFGRETALWGPALFCAVTMAQLMATMVLSGVPWFKSVELRTMVSDLGWMKANGIPSTLLLCAPAMLYLLRITPARSLRRWAALAAFLSPFVTSLLVAARGPFLLAAGYLIVVAVRIRRSFWYTLAAALTITLSLSWTPIGQGLTERFTSPRALESTMFRFNSWSIAWQRGVDHLPWGLGAGQGLLQTDELLDEDPHNFALTLFSEDGLLATLVWFWMMAVLWHRAGLMRRDPELRDAGTALRGTLALGLINAMFDPTLKSNPMYHLFWWNIGLLEAGALGASAAGATPASASTSTSSVRPTADS